MLPRQGTDSEVSAPDSSSVVTSRAPWSRLHRDIDSSNAAEILLPFASEGPGTP
jgi:hypothetical protein